MTEKYDNVWDAIYDDDPTRAESLKIKSELMIRVEEFIKENGLTQKEAAKLLGVTQPRISDLVRGKIDRFTIDMLINMLSQAGIKVDITIKKAA
ncbi:MAG: XRE family transcriptional regulator [Desulfobulbaceae bacterium]|nr:XRE family transcriptional regulator [Desulfobulbaceae bacterium]